MAVPKAVINWEARLKWDHLYDAIRKWAECEGQPRPPTQNCLCRSCRKWNKRRM